MRCAASAVEGRYSSWGTGIFEVAYWQLSHQLQCWVDVDQQDVAVTAQLQQAVQQAWERLCQRQWNLLGKRRVLDQLERRLAADCALRSAQGPVAVDLWELHCAVVYLDLQVAELDFDQVGPAAAAAGLPPPNPRQYSRPVGYYCSYLSVEQDCVNGRTKRGNCAQTTFFEEIASAALHDRK